MPPLFGWNRFILEGFGTSCTFDYISTALWDRIFILILVTGGFFVPLSIILLSYYIMLKKLSQRKRSLVSKCNDDTHLNLKDTTTYSFSQLNTTNEIRGRHETLRTSDYNDESEIIRNMRQTEARATRTALLICTVFCLAWGPYALMALISLAGFNRLINAYTTAILGILTKVAACINPLIYATSLSEFREQIYSYAKSIWHRDQRYSHRLRLSSFDHTRKNLSNLPDSIIQQQMQSTPVNRDSL